MPEASPASPARYKATGEGHVVLSADRGRLDFAGYFVVSRRLGCARVAALR
jgi:hypothetical protein